MAQDFARKTNNTTTGAGAPNFTPAFIGQEYVDTQTGSIYKAMGTAGAYNWAFVGKGATSAFNKDTVPGLIAWYEASNPSNLTLSGTSVTGWLDLSGSGKHMTVDTSSPSYVSNVQNGLSAIYFNGINQGLKNTVSIVDVPTPYTIVTCIRSTNWGTGTYQTILGAHSGGQNYGQLVKNTGSTVLLMSSGTPLSGPTLSNATSYILSFVFNGASSQIWVNGTLSTTGNVGTLVLADTNIGVLLGVGEWWQGYGFEQMYYSGALSSNQLGTIHTMLNNKWGVY